jgi:hypothetical protein
MKYLFKLERKSLFSIEVDADDLDDAYGRVDTVLDQKYFYPEDWLVHLDQKDDWNIIGDPEPAV